MTDPVTTADGPIAELGDIPDPTKASEIDPVVFRESFAMEEVIFFHRPSQTARVHPLV